MCKVVDDVFSRWQGFVVGEEEPFEDEIRKKTKEWKTNFRSIALSIAIERVAKATLMRGIWP